MIKYCKIISGCFSWSLGSDVSKVTGLWGSSLCVKSKSTVTQCSDWVTRLPFELFNAAKANIFKILSNAMVKKSSILPKAFPSISGLTEESFVYCASASWDQGVWLWDSSDTVWAVIFNLLVNSLGSRKMFHCSLHGRWLNSTGLELDQLLTS